MVVNFENGRLVKKWIYNPKTESLQTITETSMNTFNTLTINSISYTSISENELLPDMPGIYYDATCQPFPILL